LRFVVRIFFCVGEECWGKEGRKENTAENETHVNTKNIKQIKSPFDD
jgi:hypothetical protein